MKVKKLVQILLSHNQELDIVINSALSSLETDLRDIDYEEDIFENFNCLIIKEGTLRYWLSEVLPDDKNITREEAENILFPQINYTRKTKTKDEKLELINEWKKLGIANTTIDNMIAALETK